MAAKNPWFSKQKLVDDDIEAIRNGNDFSGIRGDGEEEQEVFYSDDSLADARYSPDLIDEAELEKELEELEPQFDEAVYDLPGASSENTRILDKNGHIWNNFPTISEGGKCAARNVVYIRPGPSGIAKEAMEPWDAFNLFMSDEILNTVLYHTNAKISQFKDKY